MEEHTERLGIAWGWRALAGVGGLVVIALAFASAPSEGWQVAACCGLGGLVLSFWSDRAIAVHVDDWGIRPVDPRKVPMAWRDVRDLAQSASGIDLFDAAGRKLSLSPLGERHDELVQRAFFHALASHRASATLPFTSRAEDKKPALLFAAMAAVASLLTFVALASARDPWAPLMPAGLAVVLATYAWWLWRRRTLDLVVDESGVTSIRGSKRLHVPHGTSFNLVTVQQGQWSFSIWDAEARVVASHPLRHGLAHYAAHLTLAMRMEAPTVPPFVPRRRSDRHAWLRANVEGLLSYWVAPSLAASVLTLVVAPAEPIAPSDAPLPGSLFVVFALGIASALATIVRYRERVRWLAVALGVCAGLIGHAAVWYLSEELNPSRVAVLSGLVEALALSIAPLVLGRGELRDDERVSDVLQLGAAFGCVSLPPVFVGPLLWLAVPLVPMISAGIVALPVVARSAARNRTQRLFGVPLAAIAATVLLTLGRLGALNVEPLKLFVGFGLGAALFVTDERERRAALTPRDVGARGTKLFFASTFAMLAGVVYVASCTTSQIVTCWIAPVAAFGVSTIGARSGTHAADTPLDAT
jgi:hypothetical protein